MADNFWKEMGLKEEEYEQICSILDREPNYVETGMFSVMWSEHCGYKNSRAVLKRFPSSADYVLAGPGENAGVIDIGDGKAVVFKVESHNHPSAIEPFQGAATGVGGIIRDILCMGARPIALLNSLRFGELDNPKVRYLFDGVVSGIAWYGNCMGIPTVGGEVYFSKYYEGNPLVNAMCIGLLDHENLATGSAEGTGNPVMLVGARTGRDGIHGATFASEELSDESESKRPSVQVGDPFMEKLLMEACLEMAQHDYIIGMQDLGAAGITGSTSEMAARAGKGMEIDVGLVPLREKRMTPYEIMLSESQERMLVVPRKGREEQVKEIFDKWELEAVVIGHVIDEQVLRVMNGSEIAAEIPPKALADNCPVYRPKSDKPGYLSETERFRVGDLKEPEDYSQVLLDVLSSPTIASKEWVFRQYDYMVRTNTVVRPGSDAAVLRIKGIDKAIATSIDGNGLYCYLNPYAGGAIAVAEAARNVVCSGARPLAVTDCLNFGTPEKPGVYWQFEQVVEGMSTASEVLETPVVSGNVSFYNENEKEAIYPTPVVGMLGIIDSCDNIRSQGFQSEGDVIILIGDTYPELGASAYLKAVHGHETGKVPGIDLNREKSVQELCYTGIYGGLINSAHDCSDGGLAVSLAESCISGDIGADIQLSLNDLTVPELLFSESQSRIIVTVKESLQNELFGLADNLGVSCAKIGVVKGSSLKISLTGGADSLLEVDVKKLEETWRGAIECLMD